MMTGLTAIVGSGWLLSTQKISEIAGPAGLLSWVLGVFVALLVSAFFIEIGSCYPSAGGIGYYSHVTHGRFCGFLTSWVNWLSIVAVAPVEAQAIAQYLSQLTPAMAHWYNPATHLLTSSGIGVALGLMLVFMAVNYWSVQLLLRFNNFFTAIKIIIPIITIITFMYLGLHASNFGFHAESTFFPYGAKTVLMSVITCGIIMSFNGFQSPLNFSEEIQNPKRMLPIAIFGSIILAFVIYFLLQVVFIGSVDPTKIAEGWNQINMRSPYVDLLLLANLHLVVLTIYAGSIISPSATGSIFVASGSRILYSLSEQKHVPAFLSRLNPTYHNPRLAMITCTIVGCLFLVLFQGWYKLVAVISVLHVFSYVSAPMVVLANRLRYPERLKPNQFKVPFAYVLGPFLLFVLSTLLFYAAWPLTLEMSCLFIPGLVFYFYYEYRNYRNQDFSKMLVSASWLLIYVVGICVIAYLGDNPTLGQNIISTHESLILLALLSVWTTYYGVRVALPITATTEDANYPLSLFKMEQCKNRDVASQ